MNVNIYLQGGNFKKMHSVRVVSSSIIWGKMRSSGGSISDSSENLLHKGRGEGQCMCSLGEVQILCRRLLLVLRITCHHEGF